MIPKIIHYCWFGGKPITPKVKSYIATWREHLPDYAIKRWDESNFEVSARKYTRQAQFAGKYAFISDVARLHALVEEGGVYFDTDILVKKSFPDHWLENAGFGSFEHDKYVETGLIAAEKGNVLIQDFLSFYDEADFFRGLRFDMTTNVVRFTKYMQSKGFVMDNVEQCVHGFRLFPQQLLCGKDWQKGRYDDHSTYAVHDYAGTWTDDGAMSALRQKAQMAIKILQWKLKKVK